MRNSEILETLDILSNEIEKSKSLIRSLYLLNLNGDLELSDANILLSMTLKILEEAEDKFSVLLKKI